MIAHRYVPVQPGPETPFLETDPVEFLAVAMVEQQAQGRIVTRELLLRVTDLAAAEIDRHGREAADLAVMIRLAHFQADRYAD